MDSERRLSQFPLVRYVPASDGKHLAPTVSYINGKASVQNVYLEPHNACCEICKVDFDPPLASGNPSSFPPSPADDLAEEPPVLLRLPCSHVFHKECIRVWLVTEGHTKCPVCRDDVYRHPTSSSESLPPSHPPRRVPSDPIPIPAAPVTPPQPSSPGRDTIPVRSLPPPEQVPKKDRLKIFTRVKDLWKHRSRVGK